MNERASAFASRLQLQGISLGIITVFLMILLLLVHESWWGSILAVASGFLVLLLAAYMLFDAALFRLIASHADETEGCRAVDTLLAQLHLRKLPQTTRMLDARMRGTNQLLAKLHLAFGVFLVLFAAVTTYGLWGPQ